MGRPDWPRKGSSGPDGLAGLRRQAWRLGGPGRAGPKRLAPLFGLRSAVLGAELDLRRLAWVKAQSKG